MRKVYVVGTGGLAREIACLVRELHRMGLGGELGGYIGEDQKHETLPYASVVGTDHIFLKSLDHEVDIVIGVGHPTIRKNIAKLYSSSKEVHFPNVVHPSVEFADPDVMLGHGNVFFSGVYVSCQVAIGDYNFFNWKATIGHDVQIANYCVINPGCHISGFVNIGDECLIGSGSVVIEHNRICSKATIGAGSIVTKDINIPGVYIGVPARPIAK